MQQSSVSGPQDLDVNAKTVQLVNLIGEIGPDIGEISKRLGQFKESVRYRYKEKILRRHYQIRAEADYGALGLKRVVMKLVVAEEYSKRAHELFDTMSDVCYLVAYAGTKPYDVYVVHAAVPQEFTSEFHEIMEGLRDKGIFTEIEFFDCDWFRVLPMRAQCYDFDEGVWDFDWSNPPPVDEKAARATVSERKHIDKVDLLLLKELWKNSDRSLTEVQAAIKKVNGVEINYKTLAWHYSNHVIGQRLITSYSITWSGGIYNFALDRPERLPNHAYLGLSLIVRGTDEKDKMRIRSQLNRLPFQWSEAAGASYYSQLFFPLDSVNEALDYLKTVLKPYAGRAEIFLLDMVEFKSFTIGYKLWDDQNARWTFDRAELLPRLELSAIETGKRTA